QACLLDSENGVDRKSVEHLVQVTLSANGTVVSFPESRKVGTYAEVRQLLIEVGRKRETRQHYLSWPYFPLACERLGDEYEGAFWPGEAARQINLQNSLVGTSVEDDRIASVWGRDVGWEHNLVVDLLQQEINALLKKAER